MIKYSVIKTGSTTITNSWLSDSGRDQNYYEENFGKRERWLRLNQLLDEGKTEADALEVREIEVFELGENNLVKEYKFAAEFTVIAEDVTAQLAIEQKISSRFSKQNFGALMVAKITELNDSKNLSQEQLGVLLTDPQALAIERLLWSGSLNFARAAIAGYQGGLYSTEEKAALVAEIDLFLSNQ